MNAVGLIFAFLACFCNGTFGIIPKLKYVSDHNVHPFIFNFWTGIGAAASSMIVAIFVGMEFYWQGLISGLFFSLAAGFAFCGILVVGITVASGIWMCTAVLVSYIFGVAIAGDVIKYPVLSAFAIVVMLIGIIGIVLTNHFAGQQQQGLVQHRQQSEEQEMLPNNSVASHEIDVKEENQGAVQEGSKIGKLILGISFGITTGFFGGLIPAPMSYLPKEDQGLPYVPSMGIGVFVSAPIVASCACLILRTRFPMKWRYSVWPGLLSGLIWNIGNVASLIAVIYVGISVAIPIMQGGLFVAGIWGIFLFGEIKGNMQIFYWISGAILIAGIVMLTISK
eukprot:TRINITY_DN5508_c0_g2_i2.p1 TRINITY_DN5508_c0_g2~~TRINITY_DN5508_c0_g2_i2.p1  ORF type:complete len:337 (-),score=24.00 TRINITY_DN5508_c0_g2_i2:712-1722(-)